MANRPASQTQASERPAAVRKSSRMPQGSFFFERLVPLLLVIVALLALGLLLYIVASVLGGTYV